jgi:hypothetical protein
LRARDCRGAARGCRELHDHGLSEEGLDRRQRQSHTRGVRRRQHAPRLRSGAFGSASRPRHARGSVQARPHQRGRDVPPDPRLGRRDVRLHRGRLRAKDDQTTAYHRARARAGFERAKFYATRLLETKAPGFTESQNNYDKIKKYLADNYRHKDEAIDLLWCSFAWLGLINIGKDDPELVGGLYVGVAIAERSVELDELLEHGMGHVLLGAYHARTAQSELEESKQHFDRAMEINKGKFLSTQLNYANRYYCMKQDKVNYTKMMNQVLQAGDPIPEARLQNLIAKRRARRYLDNVLFQEDCAFSG